MLNFEEEIIPKTCNNTDKPPKPNNADAIDKIILIFFRLIEVRSFNPFVNSIIP